MNPYETSGLNQVLVTSALYDVQKSLNYISSLNNDRCTYKEHETCGKQVSVFSIFHELYVLYVCLKASIKSVHHIK